MQNDGKQDLQKTITQQHEARLLCEYRTLWQQSTKSSENCTLSAN